MYRQELMDILYSIHARIMSHWYCLLRTIGTTWICGSVVVGGRMNVEVDSGFLKIPFEFTTAIWTPSLRLHQLSSHFHTLKSIIASLE